MGDRANVVFTTKKAVTGKGLNAVLAGNIVLYSHWGGSSLAADVREALKKAKPRWDDSGYATRIMISQIVGKHWTEETGYGLYVGELGDNQHNLIVVDLSQSKVLVVSANGDLLQSYTFEQYSAMSNNEVNLFYDPE